MTRLPIVPRLSTPPARRLLARAAALVLATTLAGAAACGGGGGGDGGGGGNPTQPVTSTIAVVQIPAQLSVAPGTSGLALRIAPSYVRTGAASVAMPVQTVNVSGSGTQTANVSLDLATCLADASRSGADQGTGANAVCQVVFDVALLSGSNVLDAVAVPAVTLRGGTTTPFVTVLSLVEVAAVRVAPSGGSAPAAGTPVRVTLGSTLALTGTATDANGTALPNRALRWTSDAPAIAQVDAATGVVTPVAVGQTKIHATIGTRDGTIDVAVDPARAPITVTVAGGTGRGSVRSTPAGIDCQIAAGATSGTCTATFAPDAAVTLTATPEAGSSFANWANDCATAAGALTCQITPSTARTVGVVFTTLRTLAVGSAGTGAGTITSSPAAINCTAAGGGNTLGTCSGAIPENTVVTLTATPNAASTFAGWSGACTGTGACTVTLDQARKDVVATFSRRVVTVTLTLSGTGTGSSVSASGSGITGGTCTLSGGSTTCSYTGDVGATITLIGQPGPDAAFNVFGTTCPAATTGGTTCSFTLTDNVAIAGTFTDVRTLSVAPASSSTGDGTVTATVTTINCRTVGATAGALGCNARIATNTTVTLTATADAGSTFAAWTGCDSTSGRSCTVLVDRARAVTVAYTKP